MCDICERCVKDTIYVKFHRHEDIFPMCRKCRTRYRSLIKIPLYVNGRTQFKKYEKLYKEYTEALRENNFNNNLERIVLPPMVYYYGIFVDFD